MNVLFVDDDLLVCDLIGKMLGELGHDVIEANSGIAAIGHLLSAKRIDVMVTDLRMPGMTGFALARRARVERPRMPVAFISGFHEGLSAPGPLLQKPCRINALQKILARTMLEQDQPLGGRVVVMPRHLPPIGQHAAFGRRAIWN